MFKECLVIVVAKFITYYYLLSCTLLPVHCTLISRILTCIYTELPHNSLFGHLLIKLYCFQLNRNVMCSLCHSVSHVLIHNTLSVWSILCHTSMDPVLIENLTSINYSLPGREEYVFVPLLFQNPQWESGSWSSSTICRHSCRMVAKTLPVTSSKLIPHHLSQIVRCAFYLIGTIRLFRHSTGTWCSFHTSWNSSNT